MSIRETILSAKTRRFEMFKSKYWDAEVKVESVSEGVRRALVKDCSDEKGEIDYAKFSPALIIECFKDPLNGAAIFEKADRDAILELDAQAVEEAVAVCMRVCGFSASETEKNSERTGA